MPSIGLNLPTGCGEKLFTNTKLTHADDQQLDDEGMMEVVQAKVTRKANLTEIISVNYFCQWKTSELIETS